MASSTSLQPTSPPAQRDLIGLAKIAADSPVLAQKRRVDYFSLACQSVLNRCSSPRMPFTWTINPYRGCEFGCKYCYARYTHEFLGMEDPAEFEEKIYSKEHAGEILWKELSKDPGGSIAIGTATDPYQPAERLYRSTRGILETLARFRGLHLSITTKSDLILRDLELLHEVRRGNFLQINMTITTLRPELARILEPRAPQPSLRLEAVKTLANAGIPVAVFAMPLLPGITDDPRELEAVARSAADAGALSFAAQMLFLTDSAQKAFFPFIEERFPGLAARYRDLYSRGAYLRGRIVDEAERLTRRLRGKYFPARESTGGIGAPPLQPFGSRDQLALF